eukprot:TRINITY_DN2805_c0_g2_i1.p1 TRINITY_DN2805_c0_g2~~TRINITY_DN2805_c0_g2_i1.p1  ORF type:complete len:335 (+),score=-20.56 TRINITY_DN2805_c0_g2_i1:123-1007(+)
MCIRDRYADWVLDHLDVNKSISYRLYRQHTVPNGSYYIKDLSRLGRSLSKTIIVDNVPENFQLQTDNGIFIKSWFSDERDTALQDLAPLLKEIVAKKVPDIRDALRKFRQKMIENIAKGMTAAHLNLTLDQPARTSKLQQQFIHVNAHRHRYRSIQVSQHLYFATLFPKCHSTFIIFISLSVIMQEYILYIIYIYCEITSENCVLVLIFALTLHSSIPRLRPIFRVCACVCVLLDHKICAQNMRVVCLMRASSLQSIFYHSCFVLISSNQVQHPCIKKDACLTFCVYIPINKQI